jgi:hypothetical protein
VLAFHVEALGAKVFVDRAAKDRRGARHVDEALARDLLPP